MPTKRPRISVTLTPELSCALDEFRAATGTSPSSFVAGLLVEALPMIRSVTQAAQLAKQGNIEAFEVLSSTLADALHAGTGVQREIIAAHSVRRARHDMAKNPPKEDLAEDHELAEIQRSLRETQELEEQRLAENREFQERLKARKEGDK